MNLDQEIFNLALEGFLKDFPDEIVNISIVSYQTHKNIAMIFFVLKLKNARGKYSKRQNQTMIVIKYIDHDEDDESSS